MNKNKDIVLAAIGLTQTLSPSKAEKTLVAMENLIQEEDVINLVRQKVDLPHKIGQDPLTQQPFIMTDFNRDGDSYRSPISNEYVPASQDCYKPSGNLRQFQKNANMLFGEYVKQYYEDGVGSFYVSDTQTGFACGFFAKKQLNQKQQGITNGTWDSFNIVNVKIDQNLKKINYKLNSTVMVQFGISNKGIGSVNLCGFLRKNKQQTLKWKDDKQIDSLNLATIGRMIQQIETYMSQQIRTIYIGKTKDIIFTTRFENTKQYEEKKKKVAIDLVNIKKKPVEETCLT